jgi:hypothetical protein
MGGKEIVEGVLRRETAKNTLKPFWVRDGAF